MRAIIEWSKQIEERVMEIALISSNSKLYQDTLFLRPTPTCVVRAEKRLFQAVLIPMIHWKCSIWHPHCRYATPKDSPAPHTGSPFRSSH